MDANLDRQHKRARLALDRAIGALPWGHRVPGDCGYCKLAPRAPPRPSDGCFAAAGPTPGAAGTGDPTQLWRGKARAAGASDPTRRRRRDESRAAVECEGGCGNFVHAQLCAGRVNVPPCVALRAPRECCVAAHTTYRSCALRSELVRRAAAGVALVKGADVAASTAAKGEARGERAAPSGPMVSILVCPSCFYNVVDPTSEEFRRYNAVRCTVCRKPTVRALLRLARVSPLTGLAEVDHRTRPSCCCATRAMQATTRTACGPCCPKCRRAAGTAPRVRRRMKPPTTSAQRRSTRHATALRVTSVRSRRSLSARRSH